MRSKNLKIKMNKTQQNGSSSSFELKDKTDLISVKDTNKVVRIFSLLAGSLLTSSLIVLILVITNYSLSKKEKIYVEQHNGSTQIAEEKDYDYRSTEAIKNTLTNWLYLTWEWDNRIPHSEKFDEGVNLENESSNVRVPSKVYAASYLIENGFRQEFLKGMSELIPKSVYTGSLTSNLIIYRIGDPIRNKNQYEVEVVATRIDISESGEEGETEFNKVFTFKTIEPYHLALSDDEPSAFRKQLNKLLENGLIIQEIRDL
jgi:hypothetical protein